MNSNRVCLNCQAALSDSAKFCPQCGQKIAPLPAQSVPLAEQPSASPPKKSKKGYLLLGTSALILLGLCACLGVGGWFYGDQITEFVGIDVWGMLPGGGIINGTYQPAGGQAGIDYSISKEGVATFTEGEGELQSQLLAKDELQITWNETMLDGDGALTSAEQTALQDFTSGELGDALMIIPFNLACKQGAGRPSEEQMAALLAPLQMHLKYEVTDRWAEVQRLAEMSDCPQVIAGSQNSDKKPPLFEVSPSNPVPFIMGYFPFDEKGAVEAEPKATEENSRLISPATLGSTPQTSSCGSVASISSVFLQYAVIMPQDDDDGRTEKLITHPLNEMGSCGAKCRGACGIACTTTNCTETTGERCLVDKETQENTGLKEALIIYECGVHMGCVWHDGCYDACNELYGCDSWTATYCMHGSLSSCDEQACYDHGVGNCQSWARGYGPFERREIFQYSDLSIPIEPDLVTCPIEVNVSVFPDSVSNGVVSQPYVFQWKISDLPDFIENVTLEWDFGGTSTTDNPSTGEFTLTREEAAAGGEIQFTYKEMEHYELILTVIDTDRSWVLGTNSVPIVIDEGEDNLIMECNSEASKGGYIVGNPISFSKYIVGLPKGVALRYDWDFGDGTFWSEAGDSTNEGWFSGPMHTFQTKGSYNVTVLFIEITGFGERTIGECTTQLEITEPEEEEEAVTCPPGTLFKYTFTEEGMGYECAPGE